MALEKLIKNSIDTNSNYSSLFKTAVTLFDKALDAAEYDETMSNANMLRSAYMVVAKQLQEALWCEWGLWLKAHGCDLKTFHEALVNVLSEGMNDIYEARCAEEVVKYAA